MIASAGGFLFHLIMSRMLDVKTFGEFEALISLMYIVSVPAATLITMIVKYTADFKAENHPEKISQLFNSFTKVLIFWSFVIFILFISASPLIAGFLKLDSFWPVVILGVLFLASFPSAVNQGIMNGTENFFAMSWLGVVNVITKILFAISFVCLSFGLSGVIGGVSLAAVFGYLISLFPIRKYIRPRAGKLKDSKEMLIYLMPTFVVTLCLGLFYNADVLLVKYFLSPEEAGQYGAISIIGKVIFFITGVIATVVFPMISRAEKEGSERNLLKNTLFLVVLTSVCIILVYFFWPTLIIKVLVGSKYLGIAKYIGLFGIAMMMFSIVNLYSRYFLAVSKFKILYIFVVGLLLQISLLFFFHQTITQVIYAMLASMFVILVATYIYYRYELEKDQKSYVRQ
ncbi:oligosaccharide flippase family protein [Candidatus Falkowbacteria bacterium]|nr:oligosaccharide flippase family protein [Candidatus Falkowbacteria bacterium]